MSLKKLERASAVLALFAAAVFFGGSSGIETLRGRPAGPADWEIARTCGEPKPAQARHCGLRSPIVVALRALATPVVGSDVELEVAVANGEAEAHPVRSWLRLPAGLSPQSATEWIDSLRPGQSATHRVTVRVTGVVPLPITAKAQSTDPARQDRPPGEGYLRLFPIEVTARGARVHWNATTLRALADEPPVITLANGDRATVIRGN